MSLLEKKRFDREEKAKLDNQQSVLVDSGVKTKDLQFATGEARALDFNKKVNCPICLSWSLLTKFVVSTERGYDKDSGKCPECKNEVQLKNLFHLNQMKPEEYAKFIVDYPAWQFWKKCPREAWKKHLAIMGWAQTFWSEYRKLKPKLTDDKKPEKTQFFTKLECRCCIYKAGSYCWGQCSSNIWKKKEAW
jgi:hypothetical protein